MGGSKGLSSTYEQAQVDLDLCPLASYNKTTQVNSTLSYLGSQMTFCCWEILTCQCINMQSHTASASLRIYHCSRHRTRSTASWNPIHTLQGMIWHRLRICYSIYQYQNHTLKLHQQNASRLQVSNGSSLTFLVPSFQ